MSPLESDQHAARQPGRPDEDHPADRRAGAGESTPTSVPDSFLVRCLKLVPTILVLVVLGSLGYWGHHHGWRLPKFSELAGNRPERRIAWCDAHGVPEDICISCNGDLMPKEQLYGWCKVHGVAECVLHHPDVAQLQETVSVEQDDFDRASRALAVRPRPANDQGCKLHLRRIQFTSMTAADKAGIDIKLVDRGPIVETVQATGQIVYDPTLVARLSSRSSGTVWRVDRAVGDRVRAGDVLALVDAADVGRAKADLLQAVTQLQLRTQTYQRLKGLQRVVEGQRILEAKTAAAEAEVAVQKTVQALVNLGLPITEDEARQTPLGQLKDRIQFLGLPGNIVAQLDPAYTTSNLLPVIAPRDGLIVKRDVVAGEVIDTTRTLFTTADTSRMWLMLNVPLEDARYVEIDQQVIFHPDGSDDDSTGKITWISTDVDTDTRTVLVRAELSNENGRLRNETFGAGEVVLRNEANAIVVPNAAINWEGCCHVAFVRDKSYFETDSYKVFHTRMVRPGVIRGDNTEIIAGLLPGEVIVTKGSGVLRAELLKGNLGAG